MIEIDIDKLLSLTPNDIPKLAHCTMRKWVIRDANVDEVIYTSYSLDFILPFHSIRLIYEPQELIGYNVLTKTPVLTDTFSYSHEFGDKVMAGFDEATTCTLPRQQHAAPIGDLGRFMNDWSRWNEPGRFNPHGSLVEKNPQR